jgi:hypothetical protein
MVNFQREGSSSNTEVGNDFEDVTSRFFSLQGIRLTRNYKIQIGVGDTKKYHAFDLGSENPKVIVECKSHKWTSGDNTPSAKMTVWNEAMYYFLIAPNDYRKILFVLRDLSKKRNETLAEYYIRTYEHLVPLGVEIWEYDANTNSGNRLK